LTEILGAKINSSGRRPTSCAASLAPAIEDYSDTHPTSFVSVSVSDLYRSPLFRAVVRIATASGGAGPAGRLLRFQVEVTLEK